MKTQLDVAVDGQQELRDANSVIALGTGLGALGMGTALLAGTTCPLCVIVAPALIGVGAWKRIAAGRRNDAASKTRNVADEVDQRQAMQRLSAE